MHELAVCQGLMQQVELVARRENARKVTSITLQIGPLSGVEASLLEDAFPIAAAGSLAENAELKIEQMPIQVICLSCGAKTTAKPNKLVCGQCGDWRTRIGSGDEMLLRSLELVPCESDDAA